MKFRGRYAFLSNFYPCVVHFTCWSFPVSLPEVVGSGLGGADHPPFFHPLFFPSVEHAYQAAKCQRIEDMRAFMHGAPGEAKHLGRYVDRRPDWDQIRVQVMEYLLRQKFSVPGLTVKLKWTGTMDLVEENDWGDTFWGVYRGIGENQLGRMLMKIREGF